MPAMSSMVWEVQAQLPIEKRPKPLRLGVLGESGEPCGLPDSDDGAQERTRTSTVLPAST